MHNSGKLFEIDVDTTMLDFEDTKFTQMVLRLKHFKFTQMDYEFGLINLKIKLSYI
jgi:hypothetical protein